MSTCGPVLELTEQLCYVHCGFCTTILLVGVPRSSLSKVVTVRCGHCQGLLSVDMRSVPLVPLQLLSSIAMEECPMQQKKEQTGDNPIGSCDRFSASIPSAGYGENEEAAGEDEEEGEEEEVEEEEEETADVHMNTVVKPPEKRQRAPSAYNYFIKEEIKRIKGRDPSITHKEAFSTAAKNWAHLPRIQQKDDGECCSPGFDKWARGSAGADKMEGKRHDIHKKKIPRHSMRPTASFE